MARIKELGDGFLCSVGYPFRAKSENPANDAVKLAPRFQTILATESVILQRSEPVTCGIGISLDTIVGFYPEFGAKEYRSPHHRLCSTPGPKSHINLR